jgi:hypothetical protein
MRCKLLAIIRIIFFVVAAVLDTCAACADARSRP